MIIDYDYFLVGDITSNAIKTVAETNDDIAFDNCLPLSMAMQDVVLQNGVYDALEVLHKTTIQQEEVRQNTSWGDNTLMLAKFQNNLSAGSVSVGNNKVSTIQFLKRKKDTTEWQICTEVKYNENQSEYYFVDKYIEAEQEYEYCIRPTARIYSAMGVYIETIIGENSPIVSKRVTFDYAHIFDNEASFDLLYNFKLGDITSNIDANVITTLGSQYPFTIYGASKYKSGSAKCLLVTEKSATGAINIGEEKILRNNINKFLSNKKPKILKCDDGTYMLITISDNYVLIPDENLLGSYSLSFNYTEIGDANDVDTLKRYGLWDFDEENYTDSSANVSYRYGGNLFIQTTPSGVSNIQALSNTDIEKIINYVDSLDE
jgi:hypothetical protein